jgi:hypothetical protein
VFIYLLSHAIMIYYNQLPLRNLPSLWK